MELVSGHCLRMKADSQEVNHRDEEEVHQGEEPKAASCRGVQENWGELNNGKLQSLRHQHGVRAIIRGGRAPERPLTLKSQLESVETAFALVRVRRGLISAGYSQGSWSHVDPKKKRKRTGEGSR